MQKSKLNKFIQKYNLGGNVNSVKWTADANQLKTSFVTPDKSLLGKVKVDKNKAVVSVFLNDTKVTDAGVQELQKALPNCKIRH